MLIWFIEHLFFSSKQTESSSLFRAYKRIPPSCLHNKSQILFEFWRDCDIDDVILFDVFQHTLCIIFFFGLTSLPLTLSFTAWLYNRFSSAAPHRAIRSGRSAWFSASQSLVCQRGTHPDGHYKGRIRLCPTVLFDPDRAAKRLIDSVQTASNYRQHIYVHIPGWRPVKFSPRRRNFSAVY